MKTVITFIFGLLAVNQITAQTPAMHCGHKRASKAAAKTTIAHPAEDNYDVKYLKFNLNMTNTSVYLSGDVTTRAKVVSASMPAYVFELDTTLTIDSILFNGTPVTVASSLGSIRTVTLPSSLSSGAVFTAHVFYHGMPYTAGFPNESGINNFTSTVWTGRATYTSSECYHAMEWWPCKQSLRDKIDSVDMWVTVDTGLKAGSNGLLDAVVPVDASHVRYQWKERYPIDYYLISVAVGDYVDYSYYMHFTGSPDSMLIQNYVFKDPGCLPANQLYLDTTGIMVDYFSQLIGRYPFFKEKYGHCMAFGGMENQTMTTAYDFEPYIVSHELGHQWFGDNVTCGTWADIFLNEGFADYISVLYEEHFHGVAASRVSMTYLQNYVKSVDTGTIFVDDTTIESRVFDSRLSYSKGDCALHMLRFVINNDTTFFNIWKNYQQQFGDSNAVVGDFLDIAKSIAGPIVGGVSLDTFFTQWIYKEGYPKYAVKWNQAGSDVFVEFIQTTAVPSSVSLFTLPIEIRLQSASGDTVVKVLNNANSQLYHFTFSNPISNIQIDPNIWLEYKLLSKVHDPTLSISDNSVQRIRISPNPTFDLWIAENLDLNSLLRLTDINGRVVWQGNTGNNHFIEVSATGLAAGLYILQVAGNSSANVVKLQKE